MNKKVILITGASLGIGRACADHLHREGWDVVGASRGDVEGVGWHVLRMDVDDDASVAEGVDRTLQEQGRLDAVLACAGWGLAGPVEMTPISDAKAQFETNFWGVVRVVQATLPALRSNGAGRVILMSSIGGLLGIPFQAFYSASKFALEGYGESLAYEVAPFNIAVTLVEPGNFKTEFTARRQQLTTQGLYATACTNAVGRMERGEINGADPHDVAKLVDKLLHSSSPPRRVTVGKTSERMGPVRRRLMPFRFFERRARSRLLGE